MRTKQIKKDLQKAHGEATAQRNRDKAIPLGKYKLVWHTSDNFPKRKYGKIGNPKYLSNGFPKLYNDIVPKSRGILIHPGTTGGDTEGCLMPGFDKMKKKDGTIIGVGRSQDMFFKLIEFIEEKGIENIRVEIKDE